MKIFIGKIRERFSKRIQAEISEKVHGISTRGILGEISSVISRGILDEISKEIQKNKIFPKSF